MSRVADDILEGHVGGGCGGPSFAIPLGAPDAALQVVVAGQEAVVFGPGLAPSSVSFVPWGWAAGAGVAWLYGHIAAPSMSAASRHSDALKMAAHQPV